MFRLPSVAVVAALTAFAPSLAMAQSACQTVLTRAALRNIFQGAGAVCVCGAPGAARPDLKWNESHVGGGSGNVFELGLETSGRGDQVATYRTDGANANSDGVLHYDYGGGTTFDWTIDAAAHNGTTYQFCTVGHAPAFSANIKPGNCTASC